MRSGLPMIPLVGLLQLTCVVGAPQMSPPLSDSGASRVVEEFWATTSLTMVRLGEIKALTPMAQSQAKPEAGVIDYQLEKFYDLLQRAGVLRLNRDRDLSKENFSSWDNFHKLSVQGIRRSFEAQLLSPYLDLRCNARQVTALASRAGMELSPGVEYACLTHGSSKVEQIIRNEPREIGIEKYQVVFGTYRSKWDPLYMKIVGQIIDAGKASEYRKFRALLKYDQFSKRWSLAANDDADRDQEFTSNNVGRAITPR